MGPIGRNNQQHAPTVATTPSHHTPSKNPSTPTPTLTIPASYRPSGAENGASWPGAICALYRRDAPPILRPRPVAPGSSAHSPEKGQRRLMIAIDEFDVFG